MAVDLHRAPMLPAGRLTVSATTGQGKLVKSVVATPSGSVGNGGQAAFAIATPDDNLLRFFVGVFIPDTTIGVHTELDSSGRKMYDADHGIYSPTHGPIACYVPCAPNVQLGAIVHNNSGSSFTLVPVTIFYEVRDPNWTIGA